MHSTINNYLFRDLGSILALEGTMEVLSRRLLLVLALVVYAAAGIFAGGWSVITVADFPVYAVAGRTLTLTFSVRQHGQTLVNSLTPLVQASTPGSPPVVARATPTSRTGEYAATLTLDRVGDWSIVIDGGFNAEDKTRQYNSMALPGLRVIPAGTAPLVLFSEAERGAVLLVTKGCVSCHAPGGDRDLARRNLTADRVKAVLADPAVIRGDMPDLGLQPAEISALTAHLLSGRARQTRR
jgi:hypothetical protein